MSQVPLQPPAERPPSLSSDEPGALPAVRGPLGDLPEHVAVILALLITVAIVTGIAFGINLLLTNWIVP